MIRDMSVCLFNNEDLQANIIRSQNIYLLMRRCCLMLMLMMVVLCLQVEAKCTIEQPTSVASLDTVFSLAATRIIVPPMSSVTVQVSHIIV